jgi:hypothetical protein
MPSTLDPPDMPRLHALDEEFGEDPAAALHAGRRKTRLVMLAGLVLGLGAIGVLAFAWTNADGRLRFELQSATSPKTAQPPTADDELDRLRRELDVLKDEVKDLTEAQRQAAHTIATVKAAEQELRRNAPAPYWYSNLEALDTAIPKQPRWDTVAPLPRRPPAARSEPR